MHLLEFQATMMKSWFDATSSMMSAASGFWMQALPSQRSVLSTASPWWMPPQAPSTTLPFVAPFAPPAFAANPLDPRSWLPSAHIAPTGLGMFGASPMGLMPWTALAAPFMMPPFTQPSWPMNPFAMMAPFAAPWASAIAPPASKPWDDMFSAYRSASGHATAAIIKAMAPPQPERQRLAPMWPFLPPFGSRLH